jgi:5-methylcytosine-specific restriction endonuclease McrA
MSSQPSRIKSRNKAKTRKFLMRSMTNYYSHTCIKCGKKNIKLTKHHIVPKSEGGSNELSNIYYICRHCHDIIHNMLPKAKPSEKPPVDSKTSS